MFEVDASAAGFGREADLDLGNEIGIVDEFRRELPDEDQPRRRLPGCNLADLAFRSVDIELVPTATLARLDDRTVEVGGSDLVRLRPPAADARGEHLESMVRRRVD